MEHSDCEIQLKEQGYHSLEDAQKKCLDKLYQVAKEMPKSFSLLTLELIDSIILQLNTHCAPFFQTIFKPRVCFFFFLFLTCLFCICCYRINFREIIKWIIH